MTELKIDSTPALIVVGYGFAEQDSVKLEKTISEFIKGKKVITIVWNCTPVMMGGQMGRGQLQANIVIVPTCYIRWETTQKEYETFLNRLQLTGKTF